MVYTTFVEKMQESVQASLGEEDRVEIVKIQKLNGVFLQGLVIRKASENVTPTIYLDYFYNSYNNGKSMEELTREFIEIYEKNRISENTDLNYLNDYERAKKLLGIKLINYEKNKEMLREVPYVRYLNLAAVFYCQILHPSIGRGSVLIKEEHRKRWGITKKKLYEDALNYAPENAPYVISSIEEVMDAIMAGKQNGFFGKTEEQKEEWKDSYEYPPLEGVQLERSGGGTGGKFDPNHVPSIEEQIRVIRAREGSFGEQKVPVMLIGSNAHKLFGASVLLYPHVLEETARNLGCDLYILPSSVHELILLPDIGGYQTSELLSMVKEVNATQVEAEEFLADAVYFYDRGTGEVRIAEPA